ncbi:MAG TPA: TIGR01777 family oxidoreductase [Pyrinomonadaceae bacterium]|nr:TIGR01777 family oxidoreductase [Pyrinomonadaceae bacterium]
MKILVSGSHGLVGSAFIDSVRKDGVEVYSLVRGAPKSDLEIEWHPNHADLKVSDIEGMDVVVHLAGESIAEGRWSDDKKKRIRDSRVNGTAMLSRALVKLNRPPQVFVCASAIGYYGSRGDEVLTEASSPGDDFLSSVCVEWEQATEPASNKGIRTVKARFGIILSTDGGALAKMLPPFRMGVGGRVGDGKQWMSWIALDDVVSGLRFVIETDEMSGPVNFVAPNPVTNSEFTKSLGKALSRPTIFPIPAFAVRLAFGEMADALLLSSTRVNPVELTKAGYDFSHPHLAEALQSVLAKA